MSGNKYSPKQAASIKKYLSSMDEIKVRMPKGKRAYYQEAAKKSGESLNAFTLRALDYLIKTEELLGEDKNKGNN